MRPINFKDLTGRRFADLKLQALCDQERRIHREWMRGWDKGYRVSHAVKPRWYQPFRREDW